jgi:hypothetical protein
VATDCRSGLRLRLSDPRDRRPRRPARHGWKMSHRVWDRTTAALPPDTRVVRSTCGDGRVLWTSRGAYDFAELVADVGVGS